MTTNLGTRDISKGVSVGFARQGETRGSYDRMKAKVGEELKQHFRPEFLNRVDDIIVFHQLEQDEIFEIVDLMIAKLDDRLKDRDMGIELRPAAKKLLSERGYDPVLGARPLRRTIQREIEDMLSEKILFGELRPGTIVVIDTEGTGDEAKFTFGSRPKPDSVPDAADLVAATASEPSSGTNPSVAPSSDGPGTAQALG
jgi:ATP-dependent Clp protease ATP-binding subunit ClpC